MANPKLRVVKGVMPKKREFIDWPEAKLIQLLKFGKLFISYSDRSSDDAFLPNTNNRSMAEYRANDEPYWEEFLVRMDLPLKSAENTHRKFGYALMGFVRNCLAWLKSNPHAITPEVRELLESTNRYKWALTAFKMVKTEIGGEVMVMDQNDVTDPDVRNPEPRNTNVPVPMVQFNEGIRQFTKIFKDLTSGIKPKDIKDMDAEKKIRLAIQMVQPLAKIHTQYKPNAQSFTQININAAGREELEKSFVDYAENQAEQ